MRYASEEELAARANPFCRILLWAQDRNLIEGSTPKDQLCKLVEEVGELADGIGKIDVNEIADAIGDCAVVLTILAAQYSLDFERCVEVAYNEIKDRKGRMVDGMFVKEEDA